jgi:hypothetical protein
MTTELTPGSLFVLHGALVTQGIFSVWLNIFLSILLNILFEYYPEYPHGEPPE